jgi:hypothetical protein
MFLILTHKQIQEFTTTLLCFPKKPNTPAGFEPGSSVSEAYALSTAPRRQGFMEKVMY